MADGDSSTSVRAATLHFDDVDALTESVQKWDLHFTQLDRGRFDGRLSILQWDEILLQEAGCGRTLEQHGSSPRGLLTFGIPATPDFSILWRGHRVGGSNIMLFPPNGELYSVSSPGFDVFTISVSERKLDEVATLAGLPRPDHGARKGEVLRCEDGAMDELRALLRRLTSRVGTSRNAPSRSWAAEELGFELPRTLLSTLSLGREDEPLPTSQLRSTALARVERFIADHAEEPLRVTDLCRATGVSERTLRYAFRERYGLGPKAYLAARQLDLVRRALRRGDAHSTRVAEVAGRFGYWHMGHLAADYRRQFGELPSATLGGSSTRPAPVQDA